MQDKQYQNERLPILEMSSPEEWIPELNQTVVPRAQLEDWSIDRVSSDVFVGLSISGGGSRAANFGAAVLEKLHLLGILK